MNRVIRMLAIAVLCCVVTGGRVTVVNADVATDYLTIKVGYPGMLISEYVEVGKYHWRDLRNSLELHKVAYSYFQSSSSKKYNAIVDSANGFYISDILDHANIYYGDVQSLKFYVEDSKGIRTSFDRGTLFASRYYYEDLAGHRTVLYGTKTVTEEQTETVHHDAEYKTETYVDEETGEEKTREVLVKEAYDEEVTKEVTKEVADKTKIVGYSFEEAGRYVKQVQPMLAIEDNWAQFSEEFEHIGSDFSSMNAGNRFRLLFGQTSPTESMTSKSDKYVSCVYVTLDGMPSIGEMGELSDKIGSHTVEMTVSADNEAIRNALSELMNVNSTNTDVMTVSGIEVIPDSRYSDLAKVVIHYKVRKNGEASLTVGVGSGDDSVIATRSISTKEQTPSDSTSGDTSGKTGGKSSANGSGSKSNADNKVYTAYQLSDEASQSIEEALMQRSEIAAASDENIQELTVKDDSDEKEDEQRRILALTGLGLLGMGVAGGAAEMMSFNIRFRGRRITRRRTA